VNLSARAEDAGDSKQPRFDLAWLKLIVPIGAIVAVAVICLVIAIVSSARRADEMAVTREQQLIQQAIVERGARMLRQVESVATTERATQAIREQYDPRWVNEHLGRWLQNFFDHDLTVVVDGAGQIVYSRSRAAPEATTAQLLPALDPILDFMRSRTDTVPAGALPVTAPQDAATSLRSAGWIMRALGKPAIVLAVVIGSEGDLAAGKTDAPVVASIKFIDGPFLQAIGDHLQLSGLRAADGPGKTPDGYVTAAITDPQGDPIADLAWNPSRPGGQVALSILPFVAIAIAGLALLAGLIMRHTRRTAQAIAAGETQLRHLALHDPVCGLPNRIYFGERLEKLIGEVRRGGPSAAVFFIDLDHFKDVNDTLGHHIGDELILAVTQRLSHVMRSDELVARLGGDEFAILTICASDTYSLQAIAGRIIAAVCAPYSISGHAINIGASIGIAVIDRRARDAGDILRYADMALYRAKNEGRNRACIYDDAMDADLSQRKLLESELLHAVRNDGLAAAYQPIVNASGDTMVAVEALARWTHPTAGVIPPSIFIPIAENSGLIVELGESMLRRACMDGGNWPGLTVAVNVSPLQFRRSDFVDVIERILKETDFDPGRLELELTESTLLGNLETAELSMLRLKAIGVRFALDDFGTGYSSLLYLRRFPFDKLKIDSSFVRSIETAPDVAAIVHAVVSLGRGLGMRVTAEGVENAEQHLFLRAAGVHSMQGYRFGRPGPPADISARIAAPNDYRVVNPDKEIALAS
jgi:diguanylate cyclase